LLLAILCILTACSTYNGNDDKTKDETSTFSVFPNEVIDHAGRRVYIETEPQRIVSLAPSNTEIMFAIGLGDKLVGVTGYCNYPEEALDIPKIGGYKDVNLESLVSLTPDLVLATDYHLPEVVPQLENLGINVLVVEPVSLNDVIETIILLGKCAGEVENALHLTSELRNRINVISKKTSDLQDSERWRTMYVVAPDPLWVAGTDTLVDELIVIAGGVNIASDLSGFSPINLENVVMANPQVIVAGSSMGSHGSSLSTLYSEERFDAIDARKYNRIYEISTDLVSRSGPRIVEGLEYMAKMIHPEIFGSIENNE